MNRNLKSKITELKQQGKKLVEIAAILKCSTSTVSYHLYAKTKESTKQRTYTLRKKNGRKQYPSSVLSGKVTQFHRLGRYSNKVQLERTFTTEELRTKLGKAPTCYLTGLAIDLTNPSTYSLDHILPVSKGGPSTLENLGLCTVEVNQAKSSKTPEEFMELCKKVLTHAGYTVSKS